MKASAHLKCLTKEFHSFADGGKFRVIILPQERHNHQTLVCIVGIVDDLEDRTAVISRVGRERR